MKRFTVSKAVAGAAVAAGLLIGAATPRAAQADETSMVAGNADTVRYASKGAQGAGLMRVRPQRQQSVAGFRVETGAQGQQWMTPHPMSKGAMGAGSARMR